MVAEPSTGDLAASRTPTREDPPTSSSPGTDFDTGPSYANLAAAGIDWRDALHILKRAHHRVRHHTGAVLRIAAPDRDGRWLTIALIEETDDAYLVVGGRYLDQEEIDAIRKMMKGES
ncbi:hypothetical protein ACFP2T_43275 [Plantactinospora solaniradicis]|uniref:Uncharacterized protein n=1 Tax=Plantactinospora solaniradicis TaxID=1723736 RepID=A0ABW1KMA5_9ACTN